MLLALIGFSGTCFAAATQNVNVSAQVPQQSSLTVAISRVVGTTWTTATGIDFGALVFDSVNNVFGTAGGAYYAVDVGVSNNASAWTLTHTGTSITDGVNNLDSNVNVTFMRQTSSTTGTQLDKVTYANSNNKSYTNTQLAGGWLRIYYGVATGDTTTDAPGATPVTTEKANGNYAGVVTIQMTP